MTAAFTSRPLALQTGFGFSQYPHRSSNQSKSLLLRSMSWMFPGWIPYPLPFFCPFIVIAFWVHSGSGATFCHTLLLQLVINTFLILTFSPLIVAFSLFSIYHDISRRADTTFPKHLSTLFSAFPRRILRTCSSFGDPCQMNLNMYSL